MLRSREGAAAECRSDGAGAVIGLASQAHHRIQVQPGFGGCTHDLEDHEVPGNATALFNLGQRSTGDVVRDQYVFRPDSLGIQPFTGHAEVEDIAGIVAIGEDDAGTRVRGLCHGVGLLGGR